MIKQAILLVVLFFVFSVQSIALSLQKKLNKCDVVLSHTSILKEQHKHPRLFFQHSEIESLKKQSKTTHSEEWESLLSISKRTSENVSFKKLSSKLLHNESENLMAIALVQMIDPSQPYLPYLKKSVIEFCSWTKWDQWFAGEIKVPVNDLSLGQALIGICGAYDIQHNQFSKEERGFIESRLVLIGDHYHDDYSRFSTNRIDIMNCNHGTNAYGGLSAVLYTVDNLDAELKEKWEKTLEHKFDRLTSVMNNYMSDGASDEGATYYMFQLKTYLQWFEILRNCKFKSDTQPYSDLEWFKNTVTYCVYSVLPGGNDNFGGLARFADCNPNFWGDPKCIFPLMAKIFNDPMAQWIANDLAVNNSEAWRDKAGNDVSKGDAKYDVWRYLWKDASVKSEGPEELPNWHLFEDLGIFAWRSSWANNASYFTCRSGQHYQGHGQPDDGQFMLHKAGIPYIVDLGYSNPKTTREHNVLIVDGKGQIGEGQNWPDFGFYPENKDNWGRTDFYLVDNNPETNHYFNVVLDPTNLYDSTSLKSWKREFIFLNDFYVLHDVIENKESAEAELLLNSYVSEPGEKDTYEYLNTRNLNPFNSISNNQWEIIPSTVENAEPLLVYDLSGDNWKHDIKESWYSDNYIYKVTGKGMVHQGYHISSTAHGKDLAATKVFGFEEEIKGLIFKKQPNGIQIKKKKKEVGSIIWESDKMNGYYKSGVASTWFFRNIKGLNVEGLEMVSTNPVNGTIMLKDEKLSLLISSKEKTKISLKGLPANIKLPASCKNVKVRGTETIEILISKGGVHSL